MRDSWILTLERNDLAFVPGQYIHLSPGPGEDRREYSVYSPADQETLEVLVKIREEGAVSPRLCGSPVGSLFEMEGPAGEFILSDEDRKRPVVMIATGSGISPFASLVRSSPGLDCSIIHGLTTPEGTQEFRFFRKDRYRQCISRGKGGDFSGRVTDYLSAREPVPGAVYMLCGSSDMIYEVMAILRSGGAAPEDIRAEIYY